MKSTKLKNKSFQIISILILQLLYVQTVLAIPVDLTNDWLYKPAKDLSTVSDDWTQLESLPFSKAIGSVEFQEELRYVTLKKNILITAEDLNAIDQDALSLHIPFISSYYEVYWNGDKISQGGKIEDGKIVGFTLRRHLIAPISRSKIALGDNELRVVIAGYEGHTIDMTAVADNENIRLDTLSSNRKIESERITLMLMFMYFILGLYHLLFFIKRREEQYNLYYALFSVFLAVYIYTRSQAVFELEFLDGLLLKRIEFITVFFIPSFMLFFLDRYFLGKLTTMSRIYFGLLILIAIPTAFGPSQFLNKLLFWWQMSILYVLGHSIVVSVIAIRRKVPDIKRLLIGILVIIACAIWDVGGATGLFKFQNLGLLRFGFFFFVVGIAFILANRFLRVHKAVEELNESLEKKVEERTLELKSSLDEIQSLKVQQDGDYFLTSLLINPLTRNTVQNSIQDFDIQFYAKQKKTFEFRGKHMEIGGDINIVDQLYLKGREYIVFVNGDAMGKSMQGAGGALVLGVIFHSVVTRTNSRKDANFRGPETWLKECYLELQSVFETFDGSMLISVIMGLIDVKTGFMFYVNSEHPWTVLYRDGKAGFLETDLELRKIGTMGLDSEFRVKSIQLEVGDVIFVGSDGRDDLLLGKTDSGERIINEDEKLFLRCLEESQGDLMATVNAILEKGELTDDLSLIRLAYTPDEDITESMRTEIQEHHEYLMMTARGCLRDKDYNAAAMNFALVTDEFPDDLEAYYFASYANKKKKDYQEALNFGERLFLRDPLHIKNLLNLADVHRFLGNFPRASFLLNRIDAIDPDNAMSLKIRQALEISLRQQLEEK
ncbi:SpoIIE family protein phosphatase [Leptospira sp. GIMC2001]|uniref:SpoIIE family protein phosphatase n=1 Tax=Leptospira sp. GIMC2001 TaxID=1513297 RepID=UPI00234A74B6|nr:SpoIIE family protein phosphatase [Leptospira sp. GIMC2001]WCL50167.1 SpoIIE family protein phosphatase [Leptospira sp. GIMC2001]